MQKLSNFFYSRSTLLLAILATVASFGYLFLIMMKHAKGFEVEGGTVFLGTSFGFTHDMVMEFLTVRDVNKLNAYKSFLSITDIIYPVIYGLQYIFWFSYLYKPFASKTKLLNLFPVFAIVLDWLENFQLIALTNQYLDAASIADSGVQLASIFSVAKWIISSIIFIIIVTGVAIRVIRNFKIKNI